jgi:hypothetical protein
MQKFIYLVKYTAVVDYDEFRAVIVIAIDKAEAEKTALKSCHNFTPETIKTKVIGIANEDQKFGVVLTSFNAG